MVGVFDRAMVVHEPQPGDPSVVILEKFPIGFEALLVVHHELRRLLFQSQHLIEE